jgi:hypothetical protein
MIVDVSAINKLMDYWGEDRVCIFNNTETTLLNLRNHFEDHNLNLPLDKCKFSFFEVECGDDILIIPDSNKRNKDDLIISTRENIDLDV